MLDLCFSWDAIGSFSTTGELTFVLLCSPQDTEPQPRAIAMGSDVGLDWQGLWVDIVWDTKYDFFCSRLFLVTLKNKKRWGLSQDPWSGKLSYELPSRAFELTKSACPDQHLGDLFLASLKENVYPPWSRILCATRLRQMWPGPFWQTIC